MIARPIEKLRRGGRHFARGTCPCCGAVREVSLTKNLPWEVICRKFSQEGWRVRERKNVGVVTQCSACAERRHLRVVSDQQEKRADAMAPKKPQTANIARIRVRASNMILDHWCEDKDRYQDGWSDDKVAQEAGLSVAAIRSLRKDMDLTIRVPTELERLRGELGEVLERVADLDARISAACQRFDTP